MALSEINIHELVSNKTSSTINNSSYASLRQYILDKKPLLAVTNSIDLLLTEHLTKDKQSTKDNLTLLACEMQRKHDMTTALSDDKERHDDSLLQSQLHAELPTLDSNRALINTKCTFQQQKCNQIQGTLKGLQGDLVNLNRTIDTIQNQLLVINSRYVFPPVIPVNNVHGHISYAPINQPVFSIQDQISRNRLSYEVVRLIGERNLLSQNINTNTANSTNEERISSQFIKEQQDTEARYVAVQRQLNTELPNKEQQRQLRNQERHSREMVRGVDDPNLLQLTHKNIETLRQQIAKAHQELDAQKKNLMTEVAENGHKVYLTQLAQTLDLINYKAVDGPKITFNECEALKQILIMMNHYIEMEQRESLIATSIAAAQSRLNSQQSNLAISQQQAQHFASSNQQLTQENKKRADNNIQLTLTSNELDQSKSTGIYCTITGLGSSLISAVVIALLFINPVFFVITGALALLGLIALTATLVYHYQKADVDEQIKQNNGQINANEITISQQDQKEIGLAATTVPALQTQITESEQAVILVKKQLQEHKDEMNKLLNQATTQRVTAVYGNNNGFWSPSNGNNASASVNCDEYVPSYEKRYAPSAPPL
ncbi:MAG: hypothetical protein ACHP65_04965 [Legionellales bacterium]